MKNLPYPRLFMILTAVLLFVVLITTVHNIQAAELTPTITKVDTGNVGLGTSLAVNSSGEIVIAYFDAGNLALKLATCEDKLCNSPEIQTVDNNGAVGVMPSIVINEEDRPVITYIDIINDNLKIAVCDDPACANPTLHVVDPNPNVGFYSDIVLDDGGRPIISYYDAPNSQLKVAYCNNLECTSPNLVVVDNTDNPGLYSSLILDDNGRAVIAYQENTNDDLKIAFCNDAVCSAPTIKTLDTINETGLFAKLSMVSGRIFVTYLRTNGVNDEMKVARCNDNTCNSVSILHVLTMPNVQHMSAVMDQNNIYISYLDADNMDMMVAACEVDPVSGCVAATNTRVEQTNNTGSYTDIAVDQDGTPIVSYHYISDKDLKLATCPLCRVPSRNHIGTPSSEDSISLVQPPNGNPIMTYQDDTDNNFYLVYCQDRACDTFEKTAIGTNLHINPSMALQPNGRPALAYFHATTNELKYTACNNDDCTDRTTNVIFFDGFDPSLVFTSAGLPVITYYDAGFDNLAIAYCQDLYCANADLYVLDVVGNVGQKTSMILTPEDEPMISYYDATNNRVKFIICESTDCTLKITKFGGFNSGPYNDIAYKYGRVYVAHYNNLSKTLGMTACDMPCDITGNASIDLTSADVGWDISIQVGQDNNPLISYYDNYYGVLKLASCYHSSCSLGTSISVVDEVSSNSGRFSELVLNDNGQPVIAHMNMIIPSARIVVYDSDPIVYQVYAPAVIGK